MVAYLQKSEGSEGFHQIIDFLDASHIQYAITENPTIYVSFIKQFWRTATARTSANGEVELTTTIDGQVKTITEASLRRHLKLEDNGGVTTLPNSEIFEQLALMGYVTDSDKLTFQKVPPSTSQTPNTQPTPDAEEAVPMPHESPLHNVHSLGRDEGSLSLNELTDLCTSLFKKVEGLESELKQMKQEYSTALTKLILRVKKLEQKVKTTKDRRRARIVLSEDEEDVKDSSKYGRKISAIDKDPTISLVQPEQEMKHDVSIAEETKWFQEDVEIQEKNSADTEILLQEKEPTELVEDWGSGEKGEKEVSTVGAEHSTVIPEVSTAAANLVYIRRSAEKRKDKGKAIIKEDESINEVEILRIARDAEIAKQLQEEINKATQEQEKQEVNRPYSVAEVKKNMCIYLKNRGGFKMSHFKGMSYEEIRPIFERVWDQNQSFLPMDSEDKEKGSKKKVGGSRKKTLARKRAVLEEGMNVEALQTNYPLIDWEIYTKDSRVYWKIIRVGDHTEIYQFFEDMLKNFDRDDLVKLWKLVKDGFSSTEPNDDKEKALWVELKRLFELDTDDLLEL
ncbi:hypothetical protein Tco_1199120 [Tanacetum coccineum]